MPNIHWSRMQWSHPDLGFGPLFADSEAQFSYGGSNVENVGK